MFSIWVASQLSHSLWWEKNLAPFIGNQTSCLNLLFWIRADFCQLSKVKLNIPGTEIVGLIILFVPPVFAADYRHAFSVHSLSQLQEGTAGMRLLPWGVCKPQWEILQRMVFNTLVLCSIFFLLTAWVLASWVMVQRLLGLSKGIAKIFQEF